MYTQNYYKNFLLFIKNLWLYKKSFTFYKKNYNYIKKYFTTQLQKKIFFLTNIRIVNQGLNLSLIDADDDEYRKKLKVLEDYL